MLKQIILKLITYPNKIRNQIKSEVQIKNLEHNRKTEHKKIKTYQTKIQNN